MSKRCQNCGAEMPDIAKVCGYCGMPFDGTLKNFNAATLPKERIIETPHQKRSHHLRAKPILIAAACLIIVCMIFILPKSMGYNSVVKKVMTAYEEQDTSALVDVSSGLFEKSAIAQYGDAFSDYYYQLALESYIVDPAKDDWKQLRNDVGTDYDLSYKTLDVEKKTKAELNEILSESDVYDIKVQDEVIVTLEVTAKQDKNTSTINVNLTLLKEDGAWKLFTIY